MDLFWINVVLDSKFRSFIYVSLEVTITLYLLLEGNVRIPFASEISFPLSFSWTINLSCITIATKFCDLRYFAFYSKPLQMLAVSSEKFLFLNIYFIHSFFLCKYLESLICLKNWENSQWKFSFCFSCHHFSVSSPCDMLFQLSNVSNAFFNS